MGLMFKAGKRGVIWFTLFLAVASICFGGLPAQAAGGFALSGSFYAQDFELPQGASFSAPDAYIVVFNNSDSDFNVKLTTETPMGVELILPEKEFPLESSQQKKLEVGIEVSLDAVPGEYTIGITAESYREEGSGIQIMGAARQDARLTVTGEAASVVIISVNPSGEPVPTMIRLYRQGDNQTHGIGISETGNLEIRVTPGSYMASAYAAGRLVAEESFSISADEEKKILLTVQTVYFEGFGIVPHYDKDTNKLAMAKIVYAVSNLFQAFPQAEVRLKVSQNDVPIEEATLITLSPLEKGKIELSYNYIPAEGWEEGIYRFKLELNIGGEVYITTAEKELNANGMLPSSEKEAEEKEAEENETPAAAAPASPSAAAGGSFNWVLVGGIAGGVLVLIVIVITVVRRRAYY